MDVICELEEGSTLFRVFVPTMDGESSIDIWGDEAVITEAGILEICRKVSIGDIGCSWRSIAAYAPNGWNRYIVMYDKQAQNA